MICENCNKTMKKSYRVIKEIDDIKQCVECFWLIAFANGDQTDKEETFKKIYGIAKSYPECSTNPKNH